MVQGLGFPNLGIRVSLVVQYSDLKQHSHPEFERPTKQRKQHIYICIRASKVTHSPLYGSALDAGNTTAVCLF